MQAEIYDRYADLTNTDIGREAVSVYLETIAAGQPEIQAEIAGSNVLEHAGYGVNRKGGASFRVATIAHNEVDDARVSLKIDHDEGGFFIATGDGEDTEARFATAEQAYASIATRWGNGWDLRLAGE